ncbi:MAG: DUF92 domain-containing protein [Gemmatimonadota bacterium]|nr:DUF92 domain-containing protein [Gemmatimonadota bacterium]
MVGGKRKLTAARIAFKQEGASFRRFIPTKRGIQLREALARAIAGGMLAVAVTFAARRTRSLTMSGAVTAAIVGTLAIAAGWSWGFLLCSFFVTASALSRLGERRKMELVGAIVQKGGERDAKQVLSNGGVFALSALGYLILPAPIWYAAGIGALAASTADTWATEVGTLAGGEPISIISGRKVPPGTSGGVTLIGSVAGAGGALFIAAGAALAHWPVPFAAAALGGMAGALADSILGATLQARRWCDLCAKSTERLVHSCGTPTRRAGGVAGFDNDAVNAVCSAVGALVAFLLS